MTRAVTVSTPSQLSRSDSRSLGWWLKEPRGKHPLGFQLQLKREVPDFLHPVLVTSRPFLLPVYSWVWCSVLSTVEMSHCLLFRAHLYIFFIYVITFEMDTFSLGKAGISTTLTDDTKAAALLALAVSLLSLRVPNSNSSSPTAAVPNTANNHSALPHTERTSNTRWTAHETYSTECQFTIPY